MKKGRKAENVVMKTEFNERREEQKRKVKKEVENVLTWHTVHVFFTRIIYSKQLRANALRNLVVFQ